MNSQEIEFLSKNINTSKLQGCDTSLANIILYQKKYNTILEVKNNVLLRYNKCCNDSTFFSYPVPFITASSDYLFETIQYILQNFEKPSFQMITEIQKADIDTALSRYFPNYTVNWETDRSDTDYLYLQKDLVELSGPILQKKKNHINRFMRTYENCWSFKTFPENELKHDILKVEEKWFAERNGADNPDLCAEFEIIQNALELAGVLNLSGGVLYINNEPVAMTLASPVSEEILDIHFEKATGEAVGNGAYAVINHEFAKTCTNYTYFNREEDLGIEGLRKAKLSYKPEILLHKFHGELKRK